MQTHTADRGNTAQAGVDLEFEVIFTGRTGKQMTMKAQAPDIETVKRTARVEVKRLGGNPDTVVVTTSPVMTVTSPGTWRMRPDWEATRPGFGARMCATPPPRPSRRTAKVRPAA